MAKWGGVAKKKYRPKRTPPLEIDVRQLDQIVDKAYEAPMSREDGEVLKTSIHAMAARLVQRPRTTEKTKALLAGKEGEGQGSGDSGSTAPSPQPEKKPRPGHGRNGAADYIGATVIPVLHPELTPKCVCPGCQKGKVYDVAPSPRIRVVGVSPFQVTVYNLQQVRCNLCGQIYQAAAPPGIGEEKHDASVAAMLGQMRYGFGIPFCRIERLEKQMGIPLPAGTQFDLVDEAAKKMQPVHEALIRLAAQGEVIHHDDTSVRILDEVTIPEEHAEDRNGLHTTGIVAQVESHRLALFISGPQHAGENMSDLLKLRSEEQPAPVLMADALNHNTPKLPADLEVVLTNCLLHGRRQFTDIFEAFPVECRHVIEQLKLVYEHDAQARAKGMDPQARLTFHQEKSGPVMAALKKWMESRLTDKLVEPNSGAGKAINYFLNRWDRLTLFLRHAGAPLDNNLVERALKKSALHRKNSLFYKTQHGAQVGDLYMSIIHTCELNQVNSFRYMTELQNHAEEVRAHPADWLPWNFHLRLPPAPD